MRLLIKFALLFEAVLLTLMFSSVAEARYCNNPNCSMCNRIFGYMSGYGPKTAAPPKIDSTPQPVVEALLERLDIQFSDTVYDLGCGDGRVVITAAKTYGCKAIGIEIDQRVAKIAQQNVKDEGLEELVTIYHGDAAKADISDADVIVMYLFPETMEKLYPRVFVADRIGTYSHPLPEVRSAKEMVDVDGEPHPIYLWNRAQYGGMLPPVTFLAETSVPPEAAPEPPQAAPSTGQTRSTQSIPTTRRRWRLLPRRR